MGEAREAGEAGEATNRWLRTRRYRRNKRAIKTAKLPIDAENATNKPNITDFFYLVKREARLFNIIEASHTNARWKHIQRVFESILRANGGVLYVFLSIVVRQNRIAVPNSLIASNFFFFSLTLVDQQRAPKRRRSLQTKTKSSYVNHV